MNTTPPSQPSMDWAACAELLRLQQWQMSQRILATADALYQQVRLDPSPATASLDHRAARMVQIAIKLGRQAAGMDLKPALPTGPPPLTPEEQADVDAFYPPTPAPTTPPPPPAPTASANVTPPPAPAPAQPGAAGSSLNPSVPESKIEKQYSEIPSPSPVQSAVPAPAPSPLPSDTAQPPAGAPNLPFPAPAAQPTAPQPTPAPAPDSQPLASQEHLCSSPQPLTFNPQPTEAAARSEPNTPQSKIETQNLQIPPSPLPNPQPTSQLPDADGNVGCGAAENARKMHFIRQARLERINRAQKNRRAA